ncbi:MAG: EAL domain-containing protein [Sulfuricurvum sp.]|uniref:EAL domain-containing protein n=1 Tax=Sulfuricurvum sp. TaxID=2025608 RepID=UPI003562B67D
MTPFFESHRFFSLISTHLPDMVWVKDLEGNYIFANQSICDNLLMAENIHEPIGKNDLFFATRERSRCPENLQWHTFGELCFNTDKTTLQAMKPMRFEEYGNIRGELVYFDVHKAPLHDEEGNLIGIIGSARDITEQKRLENELNITKRLIESGPVVVFEWSGEEGWPIRFVSPNIESVLGISYRKLMKKATKFSTFIHPDDIKKVESEVVEFLEMKATKFVQEYRLLRENGTLIWVKDFTVVEYREDGAVSTIKGYVFDNTAEKVADDRAQYFNHFDQLTGLPNRQKMLLDVQLNLPKACAIFNIDSFREMNDLFGIAVGDDILVQLAQESVRMGMSPYRIGGDEFAVLFYEEGTSRNALKEQINQILLRLHEMTFTVADEVINIRMNVGVALGSEKLLTRADIALHMAKEKKLSIAFYEEKENIEDIYKKNIAMTGSVHRALAEERIICHYQPIVNFKTKEITKYETLVRMIDENGDLVPPMDFLPIAKKTKLYPRITHKVIHEACRCFSSRSDHFSVNLSIDDINDPYTVQEIIKIIIDTGTSEQIIFEILETEGIENYASVGRFIKQVKALGAKIAIDDFGTGYSNFEHILKLNVDYIKIDGSLISGIVDNSRYRIIVETIVDFARKIGAYTIAEFVSCEEVYHAVEKLGIDFSQGYYTGKPSPMCDE